MKTPNSINWWKVLGTALLLHVILIALSIITVFVYSMVINPGHPASFYEEFALKASPYVSMIGGAVFVWLFVVRLNRHKLVNPFVIGIALPLIYIVIDVILIMASTFDLLSNLKTLVVSSLIKLSAGAAAAYWVRSKQRVAMVAKETNS